MTAIRGLRAKTAQLGALTFALSRLLTVLGLLSAMAAPGVAHAQTVTIGGPFEGEASTLNGAGGTFPAPLYQKWFSEYANADPGPGQLPGDRLGRRHQGHSGPDDRLRRFRRADDRRPAHGRQGRTDLPHPDRARRHRADLQHARSHRPAEVHRRDTGRHLPRRHLRSGTTRSSSPTTRELASVNQDIVVVHRSDGSGTTFGFTDYLSSVSPDWKSQVGKATSVNWPVGLGGVGNPGVAGEVQQNPYSIGYVELIYALQNKLGYGLVQEQGRQVDRRQSSTAVTRRRVPAASATIPADLRFSIVNAPGDDAYPISTATWLLVYRDHDRPLQRRWR